MSFSSLHSKIGITFLLIFALSACQKQVASKPSHAIEETRRTFLSMGTTFEATLWGVSERKGQETIDQIERQFVSLDRKLSIYRKDSEISQINRFSGTEIAVKVSPETFAVLHQAMEIYRGSKGYFDITVGPFLDLWNFQSIAKGQEIKPPSMEVLRKRSQLVGQAGMIVEPKERSIRLPLSGMKVDLGGIGKGYALDLAKAILAKAKIPSAALNFGGQLLFRGPPPDANQWKISIRDPRDPSKSIGLLEIPDGSIATTGDYERYFVFEGNRYVHVISPKTGWPVQGVQSLTVWAPTATLADGWSTALFVMSDETRENFIRENPFLGAIWIKEPLNENSPSRETRIEGTLKGRFKKDS